MEEYNYLEAVKERVALYIEDEVSFEDFEDRDELEDFLNDTFIQNTTTSYDAYIVSSWEAAECLAHNWNLLKEVFLEWGYNDVNPFEKGELWCDKLIREYVSSTAIAEVLDELDGLDNLPELYELNEEAENLVAEYNDECIGIADWERKERWRDSYRESYRDLQKKMDLLRNTLTESLEKMQNN